MVVVDYKVVCLEVSIECLPSHCSPAASFTGVPISPTSTHMNLKKENIRRGGEGREGSEESKEREARENVRGRGVDGEARGGWEGRVLLGMIFFAKISHALSLLYPRIPHDHIR